jgi:hypothetical protein
MSRPSTDTKIIHNPIVVELLEHFLEQAKSGELTNVALVGLLTNGEWQTGACSSSVSEATWRLCDLAVAAEREACIEDCEALGDSWRQGYLDGVKSCIAAIRARGEK